MKLLTKVLGLSIPVLAVLLVVFQVAVSNKLATLGKRLGTLDYEVSQEQDLMQLLKTEVASASALMALRDKALLAGFTEPTAKQILNLIPQVPVAYDPAL